MTTARGVLWNRPATQTYTIQVEDGLGIGLSGFARTVVRTLRDPRSWAAGEPGVLEPSTDPNADLRVLLATPATVDDLCFPLATRGRVSCRNGRDVVINAWRWINGADSYRGHLSQYRHYVINHEVGHALGHGHAGCAHPGELSPVMLQQTLGLQGCRPNPWPARADLLE